ncbi:hypothetical protein BC941DRAFT_477171 [Chlamydoabsidia padenii]|nr:hypothetical protein BC941DRAFT_477171 [Chlamydoabsidia padenii]
MSVTKVKEIRITAGLLQGIRRQHHERLQKRRHGSNDLYRTTLPLVAFGAGMINTNTNHIHGYPVGSTNLIQQHMIERQRRGLCLVGHTNEHLTSQICSSCDTRMPNARLDERVIVALKSCILCDRVVNRDESAASNMYRIMQSSVAGFGCPISHSRS